MGSFQGNPSPGFSTILEKGAGARLGQKKCQRADCGRTHFCSDNNECYTPIIASITSMHFKILNPLEAQRQHVALLGSEKLIFATIWVGLPARNASILSISLARARGGIRILLHTGGAESPELISRLRQGYFITGSHSHGGLCTHIKYYRTPMEILRYSHQSTRSPHKSRPHP